MSFRCQLNTVGGSAGLRLSTDRPSNPIVVFVNVISSVTCRPSAGSAGLRLSTDRPSNPIVVFVNVTSSVSCRTFNVISSVCYQFHIKAGSLRLSTDQWRTLESDSVDQQDSSDQLTRVDSMTLILKLDLHMIDTPACQKWRYTDTETHTDTTENIVYHVTWSAKMKDAGVLLFSLMFADWCAMWAGLSSLIAI